MFTSAGCIHKPCRQTVYLKMVYKKVKVEEDLAELYRELFHFCSSLTLFACGFGIAFSGAILKNNY